MNKILEFEYQIASHFSSAIANDDFSSLNETEIEQLETFKNEVFHSALEVLQITISPRNLIYDIGNNESFGNCEICGMKAMIVSLKVSIL